MLCIGLVYYGISISSDKLSGNLYTDFALVSLADVPSNMMVLWLCNYFGRKRTTILSSVFGGLLFLILAFVPSQPVYAWVRILLGMTGKLLVNLSYNAIYIWSTELFPTSVRSKGIGVCTTVNIIGAALSPWVSQFLGYEYRLLPFIVMGGSLILSGLFCCVLSETKGKSTVETVEEVLKSTARD